MTSRLKRKLDDVGIDATSTKATESFCLIGTPLPPLEKLKDQNEFVPVWKQEVRDEKGRRRLHGAFTGGFSAGYFNTVGSKDGWMPSTFKSSRTARAQNKVSRPEDFMDDEDLQELRESQKMVDTSEQMDLFGGTEAEIRKKASTAALDDDPMASTIASTLLPPPQDSAGAQLLKKLGWRVGQGVGPRVTYEQLKKQDLASSTLPASSVPGFHDDDEEAKRHLYAPRDTKLANLQPKRNSFGLGYVPGAKLGEIVDGGTRHDQPGSRISAGFGLGALNDTEEDDLDVYDAGPSQRVSNRLAYDIDGNEMLTPDGRNHDRNRAPQRQTVPTSDAVVFHDGRPVLPGFILTDNVLTEDTWFEIPDVPEGWKPDPQTVWALAPQSRSELQSEPSKHSRPNSARWTARGKTAAEERGEKLGETGLPNQEPRSVFEYLSQKDRERLHGIRGSTQANIGEAAPPATAPAALVIPSLDPTIAQAALKGFQPFSADVAKQSRYTNYIQSQIYTPNSLNNIPPPTPQPGQSNEDFNTEMEGYAKAAMIFKPMSGAMANRFTRASVIEAGSGLQEGLHKPTGPPSEERPTELKQKLSEETPKQNAARLGMYGPLTRELKEWVPARLLCKRMGIKIPSSDMAGRNEDAPTSAPAEASKPTPPYSWDPASVGVSVPLTSSAGTLNSAVRSGPKDISNIGLGEDDDQGRDILTYQRPAMDIFKAIFADDDDSDEDEEDEKPMDGPPVDAAPLSPRGSRSGLAGPGVSTSPEDLKVSQRSHPSDTPVDPTTFHPKFVPKSQREGKGSLYAHDSRKDRNSSSKKARKALVSFDIDEGEGLNITPDVGNDKDKKRKKKRDKQDEGGRERKEKMSARPIAAMEVDEEVEWVEKGSLPSAPQPLDRTHDVSKRPGRMKAADFM